MSSPLILNAAQRAVYEAWWNVWDQKSMAYDNNSFGELTRLRENESVNVEELVQNVENHLKCVICGERDVRFTGFDIHNLETNQRSYFVRLECPAVGGSEMCDERWQRKMLDVTTAGLIEGGQTIDTYVNNPTVKLHLWKEWFIGCVYMYVQWSVIPRWIVGRNTMQDVEAEIEAAEQRGSYI